MCEDTNNIKKRIFEGKEKNGLCEYCERDVKMIDRKRVTCGNPDCNHEFYTFKEGDIKCGQCNKRTKVPSSN